MKTSFSHGMMRSLWDVKGRGTPGPRPYRGFHQRNCLVKHVRRQCQGGTEYGSRGRLFLTRTRICDRSRVRDGLREMRDRRYCRRGIVRCPLGMGGGCWLPVDPDGGNGWRVFGHTLSLLIQKTGEGE